MSSSTGTPAEPASPRRDAGPFSAWLRQIRQVLRFDTPMVVDCGDCVGCCSSSYFIPIRPDERDTLAHIKWEIVIAAPRSAEGQLLLGYDEAGRCDMLTDGKCTIYQHRPRTCRSYDCRVFTAAGIDAGGADKTIINNRVHQWEFTYPTENDRREHAAVRATANFIRARADCFPGGRAPTRPNQIAILAIKAYEVFLNLDTCMPNHATQEAEVAKAIIEAGRQFDATIAS